TQLQSRVLALETTKANQALEIRSLKIRVKKLEKRASKRTHKLKRLYKIGSLRRIKSSDEASLGDQEEASKQGRIIDNLNEVTTADPDTNVGEVVTTVGVEVSTTAITFQISMDMDEIWHTLTTIIDFLNASYTKYALTVNPTVYTSCIEQFWATAKVKNVNGEQALVDKKKVIITEKSIRRDLMLEDEGGVDYLSNEVLDLEEAKTAQAKEIASLKKRVKKLEQKRKSRTLRLKRLRKTTKANQALEIRSLKIRVKKLEKRASKRTHKLKRLYKIGSLRRIESSDEASLGDQEEASKQGRIIDNLDADERVTLEVTTADPDTNVGEVVTTVGVEVSTTAITLQISMDMDEIWERILKKKTKTRPKTTKPNTMEKIKKDKVIRSRKVKSQKLEGRMNEEDIFGVNDLDGDEVVIDVSASKKVEQSVKVIEKEVTTAEIKATKPKGIIHAATTVTAVGTRPMEKRIIMQEPSETPSPKPIISPQKPSQAKDKGKGKMVEPERPLKRKDQIMMDVENMVYYLLVEKMYLFTRNFLHQMWNDVRLQVDYEVEMAYDLLGLIRRQINEGYVLE
nr:hypothetical protein [Tanacetum cinerariifolium]